MQAKRKHMIWYIPRDELKKITEGASSLADILRKCEIDVKGGTTSWYKSLKRRLQEERIDYSHIPLGLNSNKGKKFVVKPKIPLEDILVENSTYACRQHLIKRLLCEKSWEYKCCVCGIKDWQNKPIVLQLDHRNGIPNDNRIENLRLICPNCHTQTENFCGKNVKVKKIQKRNCKVCGKRITNNSKWCMLCFQKEQEQRGDHIKQRKVERPSKEELSKMLWEEPTKTIAKRYGLSDKAVEKWAKAYGIEKPPRGYWQKIKTSSFNLAATNAGNVADPDKIGMLGSTPRSPIVAAIV